MRAKMVTTGNDVRFPWKREKCRLPLDVAFRDKLLDFCVRSIYYHSGFYFFLFSFLTPISPKILIPGEQILFIFLFFGVEYFLNSAVLAYFHHFFFTFGKGIPPCEQDCIAAKGILRRENWCMIRIYCFYFPIFRVMEQIWLDVSCFPPRFMWLRGTAEGPWFMTRVGCWFSPQMGLWACKCFSRTGENELIYYVVRMLNYSWSKHPNA